MGPSYHKKQIKTHFFFFRDNKKGTYPVTSAYGELMSLAEELSILNETTIPNIDLKIYQKKGVKI